MFINNFDPVAIQIFSIEIRWYSLAYIFGILLGWGLSKRIFITDFELKEKFDDFITYLILGIIVGGRLGYILFYNPAYYLNNITSIFKIWEGGMSFHGALIGIIVGTYWFSIKKNIPTFFLLDIIAFVAPIGIFFGRIANFINGELVGKTTDVFWGVVFPKIDNNIRHPSQLYEAFLEGVVLFIIMNSILFRKSYKIGTCSYVFLIFYGVFRIFSEFYREPDLQIGYLFNLISMGTMLSILMIIAGIILFFKKDDIK